MKNLFESCRTNEPQVGEEMYYWAKELFPLNRSLTGEGNRKTLHFIKKIVPNLEICSVKSGTHCGDWTVPPEWSVEEAYLADPSGKRVIDFYKNNLHLVGYSEPIDKSLDLTELQNHLYSLKDQPNAIPYITSYYKSRWGFCLTHNQRKKLKKGLYRAVIKSKKEKGVLNYGELIIPGKTKKEIFLSTYICHPSMANDQTSGIVTLTALARWINKYKNHNHTFRIIWIPETIGAIVYLSKHLNEIKKNIVAGWQLACLGDKGDFSYLPSRTGNTQADIISLISLERMKKKYRVWSFLKRGSDERQWCYPGVDLPVCSIMRSKYNTYKEYHTSLDNLKFIKPQYLQESYDVLKYILGIADENIAYKTTTIGEPQLGKINLYPSLQSKKTSSSVEDLLNILTYCDGKMSSIQISQKTNIDPDIVILYQKILLKHKKLTKKI